VTPAEASECVAEKFTRVMNATPSPLGPLSDLGAASVLSGLIVVLGFFGIRRSNDASLARNPSNDASGIAAVSNSVRRPVAGPHVASTRRHHPKNRHRVSVFRAARSATPGRSTD